MKKKENSTDEGKADCEASLVGSAASLIDILDSDSDSDNDVQEEMNPRLQLAMTLRNWSSIESNNEFVIREGGVHALIGLAGLDDPRIKKCVASALYHLSSRKNNREELIKLSAATGVITIAMQVRSWNIAKRCAWTLCNLSMQEQGEAVMAKDGAILALVILLGLRGQRLLPVCVQALYNLTCVEHHFKGMERIVKALINIPQTGFDHMYFLVKALVNCCRYPWMRSRIIEDGALASLVSFTANIHHRDNRDECVILVTLCLRLLSENTACRGDMVSKGSIELLYTLLPISDDQSWLSMVTTIYHILHVSPIPMSPLETAVHIVTEIIQKTSNLTTLQFASACVYMFTRDPQQLQARPLVYARIIHVIPKLLRSTSANTTPLTQYFAIVSCGFIFFSNTE